MRIGDFQNQAGIRQRDVMWMSPGGFSFMQTTIDKLQLGVKALEHMWFVLYEREERSDFTVMYTLREGTPLFFIYP